MKAFSRLWGQYGEHTNEASSDGCRCPRILLVISGGNLADKGAKFIHGVLSFGIVCKCDAIRRSDLVQGVDMP